MPRVLYFSIIRERVGKDHEDITFEGTVAQLKDFLSKRYPEIAPFIGNMRIAVNEEYVQDDHPVKEYDRVALIPPVSGG